MTKPEKPIRAEGRSRIQVLILGCLTAIGAAMFTFLFFEILEPPLDTATLLNPPLTRPASVRPTATILPSIPPLFLTDDFSTRRNWPQLAGDSAFGYEDNGYVLAPPSDAVFTHVFLQDFANTTLYDLSLQVEAKPASDSPAVNYGVFFWHSQDNEAQERFLYFGINSNGRYTLRAFVPETGTTSTRAISRWVDLVPETPSPLIRKNGEPNRLRVDAHIHRILAFINGGLVLDRNNPDVDALRSSSDFDGRVGLLSFSPGKPNSKVIYTLFDLYAPAAN